MRYLSGWKGYAKAVRDLEARAEAAEATLTAARELAATPMDVSSSGDLDDSVRYHREGYNAALAALEAALGPSPAKELTVDKRATGRYGKFKVERVDGQSAPGQKHDGCDYFVLDLTHDPHAMPAIKAYAASCRQDYPQLAADLDPLGTAEALGSSHALSNGTLEDRLGPSSGRLLGSRPVGSSPDAPCANCGNEERTGAGYLTCECPAGSSPAAKEPQ